jgi:hypothetical protein
MDVPDRHLLPGPHTRMAAPIFTYHSGAPLPVYTDTRLSFADAAIAHVAEKRANGLVLTFDEEFRKLPGIHVPGPEEPAIDGM